MDLVQASALDSEKNEIKIEDVNDNRNFETLVNSDGIKTSYTFTTNEKGRKVKITKKIRIKTIEIRKHRDVERRKHFSKVFFKFLSFTFFSIYYFFLVWRMSRETF